MRAGIIFCSALSMLLFSCGSNQDAGMSQSSIPETVPEAPVVVSEGRRLFEQKCASCHGSDGTAGLGGAANLRISKLDSIAAVQIISKGKNAMPAFGSQLSGEEISHITSHLEALRK